MSSPRYRPRSVFRQAATWVQANHRVGLYTTLPRPLLYRAALISCADSGVVSLWQRKTRLYGNRYVKKIGVVCSSCDKVACRAWCISATGNRSWAGPANGYKWRIAWSKLANHLHTTISKTNAPLVQPAHRYLTSGVARPLVFALVRTSEDGTPSVTFPRNFDRIVGLMGRNDLEDRFPEQESQDTDGTDGLGRRPGGCRKDGGKGLGQRHKEGERAPPWTKYLLEEGLDRTKAFSRYRGMFAGRCGKSRVFH